MAGRITIVALRGAAACIALSAGAFTNPELFAQVATSRIIDFDIPAGSLQSALVAFGNRTGLQLIYAPESVAARRVGRLRGRFDAQTALQHLIAGTGLHIRQVDAKVVVIEQVPRGGRSGKRADATDTAPKRVDIASGGVPRDDTRAEFVSPEVVVTGSNIRGAAPVGSNVRSIQRSEIERNGYSTVAQALQAVDFHRELTREGRNFH